MKRYTFAMKVKKEEWEKRRLKIMEWKTNDVAGIFYSNRRTCSLAIANFFEFLSRFI